MKKKIIIFIIAIILIITLDRIICPKKEKNQNPKRLSINEIVTIPETNIMVADSFYIKRNNNGFIVYDENNNKLYEFTEENNYYEILGNKYIMINKNDETLIIDKNGNQIKKGTYQEVHDLVSNDKYFIMDNKIYNNKIEEVYDLPSTIDINNVEFFFILNNNLYVKNMDKEKNIIVDLENQKTIYSNFEDYTQISQDYVAIKKDKTYDIYNIKDKKIELENVDFDERYIIKKDNQVMYIYNNKIYKDKTKINDKYHMSTNDCSEGGKLLDKNDNIIINKCMLYYEEPLEDIITGYSIKESILYLKGKEITTDTILKVGDYIVTYDYKENETIYKIYDKNGNEKNIDGYIAYIGNGIYYLQKPRNHSFLDSNLNVIEGNLDSVTCYYNDYCIVSDENENKKLYRDGKRITTNTYDDIIINKDTIIAQTIFNTYIYKLGEDNEINIDTKEEVNIDINEIIKKYELEDIENLIKNNEELFKKYAYIIENNNDLLNYKKEVMDLFIILGNNKNYLNEMFFLKKLKKLSIAKVSDLGPGVGATYADSEVKVRLVDKYNITIYHELTHFIDFSINNKNNIYYLFDCNGEYVIKKEFTNACSLVNIDTNFITEAGAELYSGKYLTNELEAYNPAPSILSAMEYILGTEEINKWYFENDAYFKKLWLDMGYSIDETKKIIKYMTNTTQLNSNASDNIIYIIDTLIDLYKNKKDENFMNDKAFVYILRNLIDYQTDFKASKYESELNSIINKENNVLNQVNETIKDYYLYESYGDFLIENNKYYILIFCSKDNTSGYLAINYDFENDKIIDYTFTPRRVLE